MKQKSKEIETLEKNIKDFERKLSFALRSKESGEKRMKRNSFNSLSEDKKQLIQRRIKNSTKEIEENIIILQSLKDSLSDLLR